MCCSGSANIPPAASPNSPRASGNSTSPPTLCAPKSTTSRFNQERRILTAYSVVIPSDGCPPKRNSGGQVVRCRLGQRDPLHRRNKKWGCCPDALKPSRYCEAQYDSQIRSQSLHHLRRYPWKTACVLGRHVETHPKENRYPSAVKRAPTGLPALAGRFSG